ncbi:MAG: PKD-like domain-containing protein [Bacteroidota bacterium]|nr:PKD-like domain-containing protein [Bacteroidota bacterium]
METIEVAGPFGAIAVTSPVLDDCSCLDVDIEVTTSDVEEATLLFGDGSFQNVALNATTTITHQYCNTGTTAQTLTPILYISSGTCNGNITANESVTIQPLPVVDNPGNFEYCEGENSNPVNFTGNIGSTTYNWTNTNTNTGLVAAGSGDIISFLTANSQATASEISTVTVTPIIDATGCSGTPESFTITVNKAPTVNAGVDDEICETENFNLSGAFGGGASSAQWSGGLGTYNPNDQDMSAIYTPTPAEIAAGTVVFTLTTDDPAGVCSSVSDNVTLTINPGVFVNAGVDDVICSNSTYTMSGSIGGSANTAQWTTAGDGVFDNTTNLNAIYTPGANDIISGNVLITLSTDDPVGPCFASTDDMILSFSNAASVSASGPTDICVGNVIPLTATIGGTGSSIVWSNGGGTFSPSVNDLTPTYTPSNAENLAGLASLIVTVNDPDGAGPCSSESVQVDVNIQDTVQVSAGADASICSDDNITLNGLIGGSATSASWTTSGTGTFDDANLLNATYTPSAADLIAGSIVLTLTTDDPAGPCNASSDDMVLSLSEAATLFVTSPLDECVGESIALSAVIGGAGLSVTWSNGGGSFSPSVNDLTPNYIPSTVENAAGSALLTVTVDDPDGLGPCLAVSDQVSINLNDTVQVSAGADASICSDDIIVLNGSIGGSASTSTWTTSGSGSFDNPGLQNATYTPSAGDIALGSVILTLTTDDPVGPCDLSFDQMTLSFSIAATVNISASSAGSCNDATVSITSTIGGTATSITWSGGSGLYTPNINTENIDYTPTTAEIGLGGVTLTATTDDPDGAGPCLSATDDISIVIATDVLVDAGTDEPVCSNLDIQLNGSFGGAATSAQWSGGNGVYTPNDTDPNAMYTPTAAEIAGGSLTLTLTTDDPAGPCIALSDDVTFTFESPASADANVDGVVCSDAAYTLNGSFAGTASSASWTSNGTGSFDDVNLLSATYTPSAGDLAAGFVTLTLTTDDPVGVCAPESDDMILTINEAATLVVNSPITECIGETITLDATIGGSATSVTWSNGGGLFTPSVNVVTPDYTPSTLENTAGSVSLIILVDDPDGAGPCTSLSDQIDISLNDTVQVSAGVDASICSDDDITLNGSIGGSASSASWSTSGTGTFDDNNLLNATYTPSAGDLIAGSIVLTLTTDDPVGPCNATSDDMVLTFSEAATLFVTTPLDECVGETIGLNAVIGGAGTTVTWTNGGGSFSPSVNDLSPNYIPSAIENAAGSALLTVTVEDPDGAGPCPAVSDQVSINLNDTVQVSAGIDGTVCSDDDILLSGFIGGSASSATWSGGSGTFDNINALNAIYTPSPADIISGSVDLILTTDDPVGPCTANFDVVTFTFVDVPTADAGFDQDICADQTATVSGTIGGTATSLTWSSSGTGSFDNTAAAIATYTPSIDDINAGSVAITLTTDDPTGFCGNTTDDVVIDIFPLAVVNAGANQTICSNDVAVLSGTIGGGTSSVTWTTTGTGSFVPDANALNPTYIPSAGDLSAGIITFTLTSDDPIGPCVAVSDQMELSINPEAIVDAGPATEVWCAGQDIQLNGSISGGIITGSWSGGAGIYNPNTSDLNAVYTPTAAELSAGNVILTLTSDDPLGTCGPESDVIEILFSTSAIVSAGVDEVICEGDDIVLNGSVGGSAVSATWSGSTGVFLPGNTALNPTFTPSLDDIANGFVVLTITSNDPAGPCAAQTDEVEITINPAPHLSSSLIDDACSGLSVDYNISSSIPATYTWQAQADNPSLSGESLTSQNSSTIDDILVNNTGFVQSIDYVINATADATGCQSSDQIVTINVEVISTMDLPADQAICVNTSTTDVLFSGSDPTLTYDWLNDNPSIGLPASGSGNILSFIGLNTTAVTQSANITVTPILNGCPGTPQTFIIEVYPNSTVDNPADVVACDGVPTSDIIFTGSDPGITYNWTNNNTTIGLANAGSGSILSFTAQNTSNSPITATVTVTPELNACDGDPETFEIIVNPSPEMDVPVDQTICVTNNTADVNFTSNVIGTTYSWTNDNIDVGLAASGTGDIPSFTTTNISGLLDTANITVTPSYNGCPGPSVTFQIIVTPILQVDPVGPFEFCGGQDFPGVVFTGNVLNTVYEWTNDNTSIGLPASGTGDIGGFTLINSGTVNQVATISVDPVLTGCTGIIQQFQITVKPVPTVAVLPISQTICHDEPTIPVDFSGNISGASYDWTHSNISIGIGSPGFGDIPTFTAINTGLLTQTSNFTVTPSFNGCTGETEIFSITVEPKPTVFPNPSQEWCSGDNTNSILFDGNFGPAGATYNWTNDNVTIGLPASGSGDILSFVAQNPTVDVQTATITVVPTLNGCDGDPETITIIVKPVPTVDGPIPDQPLCVNSASDEVIFTGNLPLTTNYNWTNDNVAIGLPASGTGNIPSFIAQNSGNSVISATITVIPELNGCIGTSETFSISTIDPIPIVDDPADQVHCEGDNTNDVIFSGPNPTTSFIWTNDNTSIGLAASGSGDILSFIADNTSLVDQDAIITVTPEYNGCLGVPQTFTITVKPQPNAFATPENQEHCSGEDSDEIFFTGDLAGTQYDWLNDNVSIGLVGSGIGDIPSFTVDNSSNTPQTATINVVPSFNGCTGDPITATIIVNPISTVVVSGGIDEYCHNDPTIDYIFNGSSGASTYNWVNDNISIGLPASGTGDILSFTATNTDLVNQLATITVEPVLNGCVGTTQVIQILVKPIPTVDPVAPQNICANDDTDEINFEGTMTDTTTFGWTHDNVSIGLPSSGVGNIPSFNANNISQDIQVGNITVTPVLNGCIGTAQTVTITVNPISTVNAISDTVCSGDIVPQIDFIGNNSSSVYSWVNDNSSIGLGTTGTDFIPSFVSNNLGTTTQDATIVITPTVNGCPGINDTIHIVVYPTPIVDPIDPLEYCAEDATLLIPFTGNMAINQYDWVNDNAAIGLSGSGVGDINSFITSNTGTTDLVANITVTPSANGCFGASENFSIVVHPLPDVYAGADTTLCFGQSITLTATGAISYSWDNGVINGVPFNPNSTITYTVIGTDANLCQNTDDITVTYLLDIPPVVDAGPDQAICFTDSVTLIASGDAILYQWNNGVIDGVPFSPVATNSYVLIGTAANGCLEADTVEVVVNPLPVITANASDDVICDGESTILWGEGASIYAWDQGVTDSVSFIPGSTSTYTVIGYDINGCTDTTDIEVIVNPLPDVLFSTDMTYGGCVPFSPTFTDLTNGPSSESVLWVFGNGASSTQMGSVINTYDSYGCYNVTLISTTAEGCTDSLTQDDFVCVNPVIASFYPDVYEQSVINPIFEFTNESENATSFQWFFGDGTESDFVNTTHFYDSYGVYNVALVAMAEDGCTDTAYVAITVNDEVLFYVPNSFTPNGDGLNELFIPVLTAGYDRSQGYEFSVYNRWGEQIFFSDTPGEGWDGTYNGLPSQNGTYIWYVKFKDSMNNLIYNYSDHFNLIR